MSSSASQAPSPAPMLHVERSAASSVPPEAAWAMIGDFAAISTWHPAVEACNLDETGKAPVRTLTLVGGAILSEELVERDEAAMSYTYRILEGPLPVRNYTSTLSVSSDGKGGSTIAWKGRFDAAGAGDEEAMAVIAGVYEAGLAALVEASAQ